MERCPYCDLLYDSSEGHSCMEMRWGERTSVNPDELIKTDDITGISVKVEWYNAGEGSSGDYNPDDPDDINFLRFDVSYKPEEEWFAVEDASYCTLVPEDTPEMVRFEGLHIIMNRVFYNVADGHSVKKACEQLSWLSPESIEQH